MKFKHINTWIVFILFISISFACENLKEDFKIEPLNNPVKIGVVGDVTIAREVIENIFFAIKMAADEINSNDGLTINGEIRDIELIFKNSGGDPDFSETLINELIAEDVSIIIGPSISSVAVDMANLCIENNILMMTYSATIPELSFLNDKNLIWRTCPSDIYSGIIMAKYAFDYLDLKRGAILYREDNFGVAMEEIITKEFELIGGEIIATASFPTNESDLNLYDFSGEINQLLEYEPQIIFTLVFEQEVVKITHDLWATPLYQDYTQKPQIFLSEGGFVQELITNGQPDVVESIVGISSSGNQTSNYITFNENYFQKYDFEPINYAGHAYDALYSIVYAMLRAQSVIPEDFKKSLQFVTGSVDSIDNPIVVNVNEFNKAKTLLLSDVEINYNGASGTINFDENGDPKSKFVIWKIVGEEYIEVSYIEK